MTEKQLFTPQEVSDMLGTPSSTLRRYCRTFTSYLSQNALTRSKNRRFTDNDIIILKKIRELTQAKKTQEEIEIALQVIQDTEPDQTELETALIPFPQILEIIDQFRHDQAETRRVIDELQGRVEKLERELEYARLPIWKRFRRRKPE